MSVRVIFFGMIAAKLGRRECALPFDEGMTLAQLVSEVGCGDFKPLLLAVNQQQENDLNRVIKSGDEVAIMPPFAGG